MLIEGVPPTLTLPLQGGGDKTTGANNNSPLPWREGARGRGTQVKSLVLSLSKYEDVHLIRVRGKSPINQGNGK